LPTRQFTRRCNNGSRRQKEKYGDACMETNSTKYERCKNGTRRHKKTRECDAGVVYLFKNRRRLLAKGRHMDRTDKSANANVKKHKRFSLIPDAPGAAEYREQTENVPEEWDGPPSPVRPQKPKSPRKPYENLANPFKIRVRKSSPPRQESKEDEEMTNNYDMGDYFEQEADGDAVVEKNNRKLSPILEAENEEDERENIDPPPRVVQENYSRNQSQRQNKVHNTRSSNSRTRSEKSKYKVDYGSKSSRNPKK
jgi:hypothetical protein